MRILILMLSLAPMVLAQYGRGGSPTSGASSSAGGGGGGGSVTQGTSPWVTSGSGDFAVNIGKYLGTAMSATNPIHTMPGTSAIFPASQSGAWSVSLSTGGNAAGSFVQGNIANGSAANINPLPVFRDYNGNARYAVTSLAGGLMMAVQSGGHGDAQSNSPSAWTGEGSAIIVTKTYPYVYNPAAGSWDRSTKCTQSSVFDATASGNLEIVALAASTQIRVCHISMGSDAAVDIKLTRGTGTNCGTSTNNVTGVYQNATSVALDFGNSPLMVTSANALCLNLGATANVGGLVTWERY